MEPLIESILGLENEADRILATARADSAERERKAAEEAESHRVQLEADVERRLAAFAKDAEAQSQADIAQVDKELKESLDSIDRIPAAVFDKQVERVLARFREF